MQAQEKAPVDEPEVAAGEDDEEKEEKEKGSWTTWQNDDFSVELFGQFAAETILTSDVTNPRSYILYAQPRAPVRQPQATITGQSTLDKDSIDQMVRDAEAHAEEDKQRREEAEIRNNADSLVYQTEKVLREQGDNVSTEEKAAVEGPLDDLKKALDGTDTAAMKSATEALMAASQAFSQKLYEAAARATNAAGSSASGQDTGAGDAGGGADDDIVDAEIVDDEESK
jgi:molecular chaperone DnaK